MRQFNIYLLLGAALVVPVAAQTLLKPPSCHLQVIPDYVNPIAFKAVLRLSPACPSKPAPFSPQPPAPRLGALTFGARGEA